MELFEKVVRDIISYEVIDVIELFEKLYDEQNIDFEDFDFSYVEVDSPRDMWFSLMECYIKDIINQHVLKYLDFDALNVDYLDGISYYVYEDDDEELISDIITFNEIQPIQIEIIYD